MPIKARPVSAARAAAFAQGQFVFANNDIKNTMIENLSVGAKANLCAKQGFMTAKNKTECDKFTCVYAHDDYDADTVSSSSSTSSAANTYLQNNTKERCLSYVTNNKEQVESDKFTSSLHEHEKGNKHVHLHTFLTEQANIIQEEKPATLSAVEISGIDDHKTSNTNANTECENTEFGIKTGINTNIICTDVCAEEFNNATPESNKMEQREQHSEWRKECNYTKPTRLEMEDNSFKQTIMENKRTKNSSETEFDRLMLLLAIDVTRERQERESIIPHSPSMLHEEHEEHEHLRECIENTNTNVYINNKLNDEDIIVHDSCNNHNDIVSCTINDGGGHGILDVSACNSNFNEKSEIVSTSHVLEIHANINAALESLYNTWENDMCDGQEGNNNCSRPFIATEHYGEAYLMSSNLHSNIINTNNNNNHNTNSLSSYSEAQNNLARKKETLPNESNVFENNVQSMYSNKWIDCYNATCANNVASEAQDRLDRFLLSVHIIECVVHDVVFVRLVANYLHEHRHVFFHHYNYYHHSKNDVEEKILNNNVVKEHEKIDSMDVMHRMSCNNCVEEHSHDEYAIFNVFSETVSDMLMSVLATHVANFDESEFVEELYSTPIFSASSFENNKRDNATSVRKVTSPSHVLLHDDNNINISRNNNNYCEEDENWNNSDSVAQNATYAMNVLSYPAWRVIMAMSDFSSFFDWVMDFLAEEFSVVTTGENGSNVIVGGGHGIRALLNSTYTKRKHEQSKTNDMWTKQEISQLVYNEETEQQPLEPCKQQILQVKCNEEANQIATGNMTTEKVIENNKNESRKITQEEETRKDADSKKYLDDLSDVNDNSCNTRKAVEDANVKQSHSCSSIPFSTDMNSVNNNLPISNIASLSFTSVTPPTPPLSAKSQTSLRLRQLVRSKQQEFLHIKQQQQQQQQHNTTTSQQHRFQQQQRRPRCLPPLKEESTGCSSLSQFSATAPARSSSRTKFNEINTSSDSNINSSRINENTNRNAYTHKKINNVDDAVLSSNKTNSHIKDRNNRNKAAVNKLDNHMTSSQHNREAAFHFQMR